MVCLSDERMVEERVRELWSTSSETGEAHRRTYCTVHISKTRISFQNYYGYFFSYFYKLQVSWDLSFKVEVNETVELSFECDIVTHFWFEHFVQYTTMYKSEKA